jgi:hypothetical protein
MSLSQCVAYSFFATQFVGGFLLATTKLNGAILQFTSGALLLLSPFCILFFSLEQKNLELETVVVFYLFFIGLASLFGGLLLGVAKEKLLKS